MRIQGTYTAKTIISSGGMDSANYGQNAFFYDAAEGILTCSILLIAEFCPPEKRHIISVFKLIQDLLEPSKVKGKNNPSQSLQMIQRPLMTPMNETISRVRQTLRTGD